MIDYYPENTEFHIRFPYRKVHLPPEKEDKIVPLDVWSSIKGDIERMYGSRTLIKDYGITVDFSKAEGDGRKEIVVTVPYETSTTPAVRKVVDGIIDNIRNVASQCGVDPSVVEIFAVATNTTTLEDRLKRKSEPVQVSAGSGK